MRVIRAESANPPALRGGTKFAMAPVEMNGLVVAAFSGASLAVVSSAHCAVMCGPVVMASSARSGGGGLRYFSGRLVTYTLLGALAGSSGHLLTSLGPTKWIEAALSWALAVALLASAVRYLSPARVAAPIKLHRKPRVSLVSRLLAAVADDPLLLGAATALLPCGVLFTALVAAAALRSPAAGAMVMATFASLSGLALIGMSSLGHRLSLGASGRRVLAVGLLAGAALMIWRPIPMLRSTGNVPACHAHVAEAH